MTQRSIYQNLDPTLNGYHPDWYDKNAKLISRKPGCSVISYQCNGTGILYDYSIFPGIDLIFMDFNCSDIFDEPNEMRNVLEIRHYQEGRVEFEFEGDKVFHLQQDEFCVNGMLNMPARYSFPFDYCSGLSLVLDQSNRTLTGIQQRQQVCPRFPGCVRGASQGLPDCAKSHLVFGLFSTLHL